METIGLARCRSCGAVVNAHWATCAACKKPLSPRPELEPGCLIHWRGMDGTTRGPALLRGTFEDQGHIWVWFKFQEVEHLLRADLIVKVQGPEEL